MRIAALLFTGRVKVYSLARPSSERILSIGCVTSRQDERERSERRRSIQVTRQSTSKELVKDTTLGGIASVTVSDKETSGGEVKGGGIIHEATITTDKSNSISKNGTRHGVYPRVVGCNKSLQIMIPQVKRERKTHIRAETSTIHNLLGLLRDSCKFSVPRDFLVAATTSLSAFHPSKVKSMNPLNWLNMQQPIYKLVVYPIFR